jgi:hypothetical protein
MNGLVQIAASPPLPALVAAAGERAQVRFLEFFAATIRNANTRRAYGRAIVDFLAWCEGRGVASVEGVQPFHVGAHGKAAPSRDPASVRLASDGSGRAGEPGCLGARAIP